MLAVRASYQEVLRPDSYVRGRQLRARPRALPVPESLAFLQVRGVSAAALQYYAVVAENRGMHADEVLIAMGEITAEVFYRHLADHLQVPFLDNYVPLAGHACRTLCSQSGIAPLAPNPLGLGYVLAPRGAALAALLKQSKARNAPAREFAITTPAHLNRLALVSQNRRIAAAASQDLAQAHPGMSAAAGSTRGQKSALAALGLAVLFAIWAAPGALATTACLACSALFAFCILLRLAAMGACPRGGDAPPAALRDKDLPVYSVVLPVYREKRVVQKLVTAIAALDYPPAKLDVKLVVESCDCETLAALRGWQLPPWCEVLVAPPGAPRTKPRALNIALGFCRGELLVIYDAEDEPDPQQLRLAAATFAAGPKSLVCLQARLAIDNAGDNWLTAAFAMEYAALFDVTLPGFAALALAFPLGGTSNHFRVEALRRAGAWDAWNVTEDADLGLRLARLGLSIGTINSTTHEEAPVTLQGWRLQRQRWLKGWMQTLVTHGRAPGAGQGSALDGTALQGMATLAIILGSVVAALIGPLYFFATLYRIFGGGLAASSGMPSLAVDFATLVLFFLGLTSCLAPLLLGMQRRRLLAQVRYLALLPLYYVLMSVAAWGALWELFHSPFRWNKTDHGLAKSSLRRPLPVN